MSRFGPLIPVTLLLTLVCGVTPVAAQELEPRRWTHLPVGTSIVGTGVVATDGDIFFDPVLQIEEGKFELYALGANFIRTFEWLGKSSRIDFSAPYAYGRWDGLLQGEYTSTRRHGFGDPRIRLSMHLFGAPPLRGREFMAFLAEREVSTSVGAAVSITLPMGEYYPDKLINLGKNRYVLRPQIGVLHQRGPWQFELTTSLSLYSDNDEYLVDYRLAQERAWFIQGHVIRSFSRGIWVGLSGGFSYGGEASLDGRKLDNDERTRFTAVTIGAPAGPRNSLKLSLINVATNVVIGTDSNSILLSWTTHWSR